MFSIDPYMITACTEKRKKIKRRKNDMIDITAWMKSFLQTLKDTFAYRESTVCCGWKHLH